MFFKTTREKEMSWNWLSVLLFYQYLDRCSRLKGKTCWDIMPYRIPKISKNNALKLYTELKWNGKKNRYKRRDQTNLDLVCLLPPWELLFLSFDRKTRYTAKKTVFPSSSPLAQDCYLQYITQVLLSLKPYSFFFLGGEDLHFKWQPFHGLSNSMGAFTIDFFSNCSSC